MRALPRIGIMSLLVACVAAVTAPSAAQDYPAKPVRILTGSPATMMDIVARQLAQRLSEHWGQPVVVDNGVMNVAAEKTARSAPDGYTLMVADSTQLAVKPSLYRSLPYDPVQDFAPVTLIASSPQLLVSHPSVPAVNLSEFVAYAKRQPAGIDFSTAGPATASHLSAELLKQVTGINVVSVNYKGGGAALAAIVSGEAKAGFNVLFVSIPQVKAGRIKAYAVTSRTRFEGAPEIPTMSEGGIDAFVTSYWFGVVAPARTPPAVVGKLNQAIAAMLRTSGMKSMLFERGAEPAPGTPAEFAAFIKSETMKLKKVIEIAGIRAE